MKHATSQALRIIALGHFAAEIPPLAPHLAALNVAAVRCATLEQLPRALDGHDVLLTDLDWLAGLPPAQRDDLLGRAGKLAGWIALTDDTARFKDQITWQRHGVGHFFHKPLEATRLAALIEDIHDRLDGPPVRVIMLDDDTSTLDLYSEVLRHAGIVSLATQDPLMVLEALEEFKPDLLLVDIEMPGCRGPELVTIVRQRQEYAQLPVIFLTAMEGMQDKLLARAAAAEDFLSKPVLPELLLMAVESHAWRYRAHQRTIKLHQKLHLRENMRLQQLRAAIDEHAIVSITDVKGNIRHANPRFCAISGYSLQELLGQNHRMVKSGIHTPEFYAELWKTITAGKVWRGEVCNRHKDGGHYWVEATIVPFLDSTGKPTQYISIRTDITALKQKEEALRASDERLRRSQVFANIGTWDWNIQTGELYWSERIAPLFGYPTGELATSYENFINAVHPEDRQAVTDAVSRCVESDAPYLIEHRVVWPDGQVRWVSERGAVVRDADGKPQRMLGVVQDIHARKQAELNLVAAREEAERANQAKSDFLSSMSHELRTPMNAIIGFAQMLEYDSELNADQMDNVHEIIKAGRHLLELINEVLDLAKIESGRIDLSMEAIELSAVCEDCRQLILPLAAQRDITLNVELPAENNVFADRVRLKQVLLNLLSNAVKYNRVRGEIRIAAQTHDAGRLRVTVTDTGEGIPAARIDELFQPFNRLDAEQSNIEGTGIGLTISQRLVEMMGGEIGVESKVGSGTTFWIDLPLGSTEIVGAGETADLADQGPDHASHQACILSIDDNPINLKLIAQIVGKRQHIRLVTAHTAELGIELALAHRPDLILLDINMPGMDGYQALGVFKADPSLKTIPIIAITANAMPRDIERGLQAGFTDYLTKPLDVNQFLATIDRCLAAGKEHRT